MIYFSAIVLLLVALAARADDAAADLPKRDPFAFADFSWLNGNSRQRTPVFDSKAFTLVGSSELGRTNEVQLQQLRIGGDFHYNNVRGRLLTQFGMYSTMTPTDSHPT